MGGTWIMFPNNSKELSFHALAFIISPHLSQLTCWSQHFFISFPSHYCLKDLTCYTEHFIWIHAFNTECSPVSLWWAENEMKTFEWSVCKNINNIIVIFSSQSACIMSVLYINHKQTQPLIPRLANKRTRLRSQKVIENGGWGRLVLTMSEQKGELLKGICIQLEPDW